MPILNKDLMRATILAHYDKPYHKKTPENLEEFAQIHLNSTGCIDDITLFLKMEDNFVKEAYFDGFGCTISIASTSIFLEMIEGKRVDTVLLMIKEYHKMINGENFDEEILNEAVVFANTARQPSRIKCATISWDGMEELIKRKRDGDKL